MPRMTIGELKALLAAERYEALSAMRAARAELRFAAISPYDTQ